MNKKKDNEIKSLKEQIDERIEQAYQRHIFQHAYSIMESIRKDKRFLSFLISEDEEHDLCVDLWTIGYFEKVLNIPSRKHSSNSPDIPLPDLRRLVEKGEYRNLVGGGAKLGAGLIFNDPETDLIIMMQKEGVWPITVFTYMHINADGQRVYSGNTKTRKAWHMSDEMELKKPEVAIYRPGEWEKRLEFLDTGIDLDNLVSNHKEKLRKLLYQKQISEAKEKYSL